MVLVTDNMEPEIPTQLCQICHSSKKEGNVCHACRATYECLASEEAIREGWVDCACQNCDHYGFPCLNCADYVYEGKMGPGYPREPGDDSDSESETETD